MGEELPNNVEHLKLEKACLIAGSRPDCVSDMATLVSSYLTDDNTIDNAIEQVLEKYPSFKNVPPVSATLAPITGTTPMQNVSLAQFKEMSYTQLRNLKQNNKKLYESLKGMCK